MRGMEVYVSNTQSVRVDDGYGHYFLTCDIETGDKWGQNDKKALYMGLSDCFHLSLMGQILSPYLFSPGTRGDKTSQKPVIKGVSGGDKICPRLSP